MITILHNADVDNIFSEQNFIPAMIQKKLQSATAQYPRALQEKIKLYFFDFLKFLNAFDKIVLKEDKNLLVFIPLCKGSHSH